MGKTALATNIGFHAADAYRGVKTPDGRTVAEDGAVVGFFSLEMSAEQLATRVLSEESTVASDRIRRGDVSHGDFERFVQASQRLASVPFFIDDTPALTIGALRTRARRLMRQQGLGLIVVDYLQLLRGSDLGRGSENRVQEISEITRGLKALAKDLNVPVLALSQLSRAVEQREDKRPMLADLRESGSIEQDADVVMFVFREEYYLGRKEPTKIEHDDDRAFNEAYEKWANRLQEVHGTAEIIIGKQRHGPIGKVTLRFDGETTKFDNFAPDDRLPYVRR
jgi:replicative DNA helicase